MKPRLAAITGKLKDTVIAMSDGPVLIGRQTGANLRIRNAAVSRRHALIEKDGDKFVIADLDSRNGTFVNDMPVQAMRTPSRRSGADRRVAVLFPD